MAANGGKGGGGGGMIRDDFEVVTLFSPITSARSVSLSPTQASAGTCTEYTTELNGASLCSWLRWSSGKAFVDALKTQESGTPSDRKHQSATTHINHP